MGNVNCCSIAARDVAKLDEAPMVLSAMLVPPVDADDLQSFWSESDDEDEVVITRGERERAAVMLQRTHRGHVTRVGMQHMRADGPAAALEEPLAASLRHSTAGSSRSQEAAAELAAHQAAALALQSHARGASARKELLKQRRSRQQEYDRQTAAATKLQAIVRGQDARTQLEARPAGLPKSSTEPVMEGWLTKRGSSFPYSWQRRYCILAIAAGGTLELSYYEIPQTEKSKQRTMEATLKGCVTVKRLVKGEPPPLLHFELVAHGTAKEPTMIARPANHSMRDKWLRCVAEHLERLAQLRLAQLAQAPGPTEAAADGAGPLDGFMTSLGDLFAGGGGRESTIGATGGAATGATESEPQYAAAILRLQSAHRGHKVRRGQREQAQAVTRVQAVTRGRRARKGQAGAEQTGVDAAAARDQQTSSRDSAAARVQALFRGNQARKPRTSSARRRASKSRGVNFANDTEAAERVDGADGPDGGDRAGATREGTRGGTSSGASRPSRRRPPTTNARRAGGRGASGRREMSEGEKKRAAEAIQARLRGNHTRQRAHTTFYSRPDGLPVHTEESLTEGWLTKRGSSFPYTWRRRYMVAVAMAGGLRIYYFEAAERTGAGGLAPAAGGPSTPSRQGNAREMTKHRSGDVVEGEPVLKGEYLLHRVRKMPLEPLGLLFEISPLPSSHPTGRSTNRAAIANRLSRLSRSFGPASSGTHATREMIARAPSAALRDRWVGCVTQYLQTRGARDAEVRGSAPGSLRALPPSSGDEPALTAMPVSSSLGSALDLEILNEDGQGEQLTSKEARATNPFDDDAPAQRPDPFDAFMSFGSGAESRPSNTNANGSGRSSQSRTDSASDSQRSSNQRASRRGSSAAVRSSIGVLVTPIAAPIVHAVRNPRTKTPRGEKPQLVASHL